MLYRNDEIEGKGEGLGKIAFSFFVNSFSALFGRYKSLFGQVVTIQEQKTNIGPRYFMRLLPIGLNLSKSVLSQRKIFAHTVNRHFNVPSSISAKCNN